MCSLFHSKESADFNASQLKLLYRVRTGGARRLHKRPKLHSTSLGVERSFEASEFANEKLGRLDEVGTAKRPDFLVIATICGGILANGWSEFAKAPLHLIKFADTTLIPDAWLLNGFVLRSREMFAVAQSRSTGLIVTINAAFLQEIKEANSQVWETLYFLRLMTRDRYIGQQNMHQWVQKLTEFRRQLSTEFALEETYGYIPGSHHQHIPMGIDPAVTLKQHKELYLHLLDVCEQVEESQYVGTIGRDFRSHTAAFQEFDASLSEHERIESEMIRCGLGLKRNPK